MKVEFDDTEFHLTKTTVSTIRLFMLGFLKNLRESKQFDNECWTWGFCEVTDFSEIGSLHFNWGGDEDIPTEEFKENQIYVHI
ncbi:MAG: hypothetical protein KUG81_03135 [Gammaproteobacteria bacterium]|nr:hypothetical protein [Gammaproteobacteria bacterium]